MTTLVKTRIVKIGNSQGIRIPKLLLDQSQLGDEVELEVEQGKIIIRASQPARAGWEEQFKQMTAAKDDQLLDDELATTTWDEAEWEW